MKVIARARVLKTKEIEKATMEKGGAERSHELGGAE
jgi:hypothetical protein